MTPPIRLLGLFRSINVRKVAWLLDVLGLPHVVEDVATPARPLDSPEILALNPNGRMPILIDADFVLWESNTICRYLVNRERRDDLLPHEPRSRARVEQWIDWQATDLNDAWRYAFMGLCRGRADYQDPVAIAASVRTWNAKIAILEAQLARTNAYVAGSAFTLADIPIGLSVHRWMMAPIEKPELPAARAYYARLRADPVFAKYARPDVP